MRGRTTQLQSVALLVLPVASLLWVMAVARTTTMTIDELAAADLVASKTTVRGRMIRAGIATVRTETNTISSAVAIMEVGRIREAGPAAETVEAVREVAARTAVDRAKVVKAVARDRSTGSPTTSAIIELRRDH